MSRQTLEGDSLMHMIYGQVNEHMYI